MKEPIPELKENGSYSMKRIVSALIPLIRDYNERNETPRITKCVSTGYGLCPCPCHTGKSHTADRIYWCVCRDKPQCPGCGVYRGFDHADNCGDSQAVPAPDTNEWNGEKPTHTDRRGRHDKMMCWGDKSCPGCECMCHRPEDSTKAEHDAARCLVPDSHGKGSVGCPCKCHKAEHDDRHDVAGCVGNMHDPEGFILYPSNGRDMSGKSGNRCPCSCHKKPEKSKAPYRTCGICGTQWSVIALDICPTPEKHQPSKQDTVQEGIETLPRTIKSNGKTLWLQLNASVGGRWCAWYNNAGGDGEYKSYGYTTSEALRELSAKVRSL